MRYFDHNATHPLSAAARMAWLDAVERFPANPSSTHRWGVRAETALDGARHQLAGWLDCSPTEIVWTSGATESNNAVLHHLAQSDASRMGEIWISAVEHPCVLAASRRWLPHRLIPIQHNGFLDLAWMESEIKRRRPLAVGVMAANNESGILLGWQTIHEFCQRHQIPYFCDAAQWIGKMPARRLGHCEFITGCAHKFGGPPGIGFIKCPTTFQPLIVGGAQEAGRRAGTGNVPGVLAMTAALAEREASIETGAIQARLDWRDQFITKLTTQLPGAKIIGPDVERLWNTVAVLMPAAADCRRRWVVKLDKRGFAVSTGSACAAGTEKPSHVLTAMGMDPTASDRMIRISSGWDTTEEDWHELLKAILSVAEELLN